jgi:hypothetical protein
MVQSMLCHRKSMAVTLQGGARPLMPCVRSDRFFLISLCQDAAFFRVRALAWLVVGDAWERCGMVL